MKWQLTLELVNILKVFTGFYEYSGIVLGNALQGLIKGDVHYAKQSHSSASQASMSTVLSHVKKREENYRTRISTNSIMILQHIRPGSSSAQVSYAVLTAAISGRSSTVSLTLAERSTGRRSALCVCVCVIVTGVGIPNG